MTVVRSFWILLALASALAGYRFASGQIDLEGLGREREYAFDLAFDVRGSAADFDLSVFVPADGIHSSLRDEEIRAGDLELEIRENPEGRRVVVRGRREDLPARVEYRVRISRHPVVYEVPDDLTWGDLDLADRPDSNALVPVGHAEIDADLLRIFPETASGRDPPRAPEEFRARLADAGVGPIEAIDRIHRRALERLRPADFSGRTDALTALRLGEASCGGKSRLMVAELRRLGIQARLVGGLILGDASRKRTSHVWVEALLGDRWVPFDPLNAHRAEQPADYLRLYTGELPLIVHTRGLAFDYGFRAPLDEVPRSWTTTAGPSLDSDTLPLLGRDQFSLILLAPFALLMTVFLRQVVGLQSIGVFLPVLLGFCVTQVGWSLAGLLLAIAVGLGVGVRWSVARFGLLQVPRAAFLITFLILVFLLFTVSLERFGVESGRGVLVLPIAAMAMAVERFTVEAQDRGFGEATWLLGQTIVLAALSAVVLMQPVFEVLTVTFPEILLVVLAEIVVVGRYRGLRLLELHRFGPVRARSA
jgi:transglutaminase-like putative cysteine protease